MILSLCYKFVFILKGSSVCHPTLFLVRIRIILRWLFLRSYTKRRSSEIWVKVTWRFQIISPRSVLVQVGWLQISRSNHVLLKFSQNWLDSSYTVWSRISSRKTKSSVLLNFNVMVSISGTLRHSKYSIVLVMFYRFVIGRPCLLSTFPTEAQALWCQGTYFIHCLISWTLNIAWYIVDA